jgi:hypothetical protein
MHKEEQQGRSRPEEESITPALPPPHRGGKKTRQVCGLFIGLREHDRRLISYGRRLTPMMLVVEREGNPGSPGLMEADDESFEGTPAAKE